MAMQALWRFIGERFPLPVTVPFTAILVLGTSHWLPDGVGRETPHCLVRTFLAFLLLRVADDLSDLDLDRRLKPGRGLCSGAISEKGLTTAFWALFLCLLALSRGNQGDLLVWAGCLGYALFYRGKATIPVFARTFFVNGIFLLLPVYVALQAGVSSPWPAWMLGGFLWFSAVAHEYAHSLADAEACQSKYGSSFSPRTQAILATVGFFLAFFFAVLFAVTISKKAFLLAVAPWSVVILVLCARLVRDPAPSNAGPFHVHGFLFFLVPLLFSVLSR